MAVRSYIYKQIAGQSLIDACEPSLDPAVAPPVLVSAMATPGVVVQYDEDHRDDLDAAMIAQGWIFDAEVPA